MKQELKNLIEVLKRRLPNEVTVGNRFYKMHAIIDDELKRLEHD